MPRKMPDYTNCVRVNVDFVLEFDENPRMLRGLIEDGPDFVKAGILGLLTKERIKELFGDIHIVLGVDVEQARMLPAAVERRRMAYMKWVDKLDAPLALKLHLKADAQRVLNRKKNDGKQEKTPRSRARRKVPGVHKARARG